MTKTVRVLCIDGGGMRGVYTCAYLNRLIKQFERRRGADELDFGKVFDLISGTSTGGIVACGLAYGMPVESIGALYRDNGSKIFPVKMPKSVGLDLAKQLFTRSKNVEAGAAALERVLRDELGQETILSVYERRGIALAIPAVEMSRHRAWVFKTPHLGGHRDDNFSLVDVCMATSAAPLYRSLAKIEDPDDPSHNYVFADGGLWANNPVLVGLIDALRMTASGDRIEIYSLGTCPRPAGEAALGLEDDIHRGLAGWKFGGEAAVLALDAQESAYDHMARMLIQHVDRDCRIVRFPHSSLPASAMPYLDLDETSEAAMKVLVDQAKQDVDLTLSVCDDQANPDGQMLKVLMESLPVFEPGEVGD